MKTILIKLSGESFSDTEHVTHIAKQIKDIAATNKIGIVVGGGNFFRGNMLRGAHDEKTLPLSANTAHQIGMLSTIVNGIILKEFLGEDTELLSAIDCPQVAKRISQHAIDEAYKNNQCIIFVGGTGNPFFTTDTNAVLRALQIGADEVWKATKVDGVYDKDPIKNQDATMYPAMTYQEYLDQALQVIDQTAILLAQEHGMPIRVFNAFKEKSLHNALTDPAWGSTIK